MSTRAAQRAGAQRYARPVYDLALRRLGDPRDAEEAAARALAALAADEALRRRLGDAARVRASARPTWEESAAAFFATIKSVLHGVQT